MANINEILARAAALRNETALNSIDPERAGGIMYDTLIALNELWLQQGAALVISKIYASVAAMNADTRPVSDLTGRPIRPGMVVVIASSDSDNGSVYRYNGPDSPSWSLVGKIGNLEPVDSLDSDSTQLPLAAHQGKVLDGKISQLGQILNEIDPLPVIDSQNDVAKSSGIASEMLDKVGGSYLSKNIPVVENTGLAVYRDVLIKAKDVPNIKFKLIDEGSIIGTHMLIYIYYRGYTSPTDFYGIAVYNDGKYYQIPQAYIQNKDIVRVKYDNAAARNIGTGNIQIEYYVEDKYVNALAPLASKISVLETEVAEVPPASVGPGYIASAVLLYNVQNSAYKHLKIPVAPGQVIDFKAGTRLTDYVILKSYPDDLTQNSAALSPATGQTDRARVPAGDTVQFTVPQDGYWLLTSYLFNSVDYAPAYVKSNGVDLVNGQPSLQSRVATLEGEVSPYRSFLKYIKAAPSSGVSAGEHPKFEFYQFDGKGRYFELDIELCNHTGDSDYQSLWRITYGKCYNANDLSTPICDIMDGGENEWACKMKYFEAIGGFVGGVHGGERIDLDSDCFVKFFADGELLDITSSTEDFTLYCDKFEYIQKAALYIVKDSSSGTVVSGHPKYGYHTKITKFEDCGYNVENRVEIISGATIPYDGIFTLEYFSGLACIGKGAATSAMLPSSILVPQLTGGGGDVAADNTKDNRIIFWNDTNKVVVEVVSRLLQGISDSEVTDLTIYDRSADSKYYRFALYNSATAVELSQVSPIRSHTSVRYK